MAKKEILISLEEFGSSNELSTEDQSLLEKARKGTAPSYSPYSNFKVSAVAKLANGELISGTNQEMPPILLAFVPNAHYCPLLQFCIPAWQ